MNCLRTDNLVLLLVVLSKRDGIGEPRPLSIVSTVNPVICVCRFRLHRSGPALQGPQRPVCVRHKHVSEAHNIHPQLPCLRWQKSDDHEIITQRECLLICLCRYQIMSKASVCTNDHVMSTAPVCANAQILALIARCAFGGILTCTLHLL